MSLLNDFNSHGKITTTDLKTFLILLNPVAPHNRRTMAGLRLRSMLHDQNWPVYDEEKIKDDQIEMPIQINGKVRGTVVVPADSSQDMIKEKIEENENLMKYIEGKKIVKEIFVKGKIYNIVVK